MNDRLGSGDYLTHASDLVANRGNAFCLEG